MGYDKQQYQSKNVYLPKELCTIAEEIAKSRYMNFSVYIRSLIVEDVKKEQADSK
jgi:hypothetical protein